MARTFYSVTASLLMLSGVAVSQQNRGVEWQGLVPLVSNRRDVEKKLGKPIDARLGIFDTERFRVTIWFSGGRCREDAKSVWDVEKDKVVGFLVSPKVTMPLAALQISETQVLTRSRIVDDMPTARFVYSNPDRSLEIETSTLQDGSEDVQFAVYKPGSTNDRLLCPKYKASKKR